MCIYKQYHDSSPLYIFIHLPKTGGTSFSRNLRQKLGDDVVVSIRSLERLTEEQKQRVILISGHEVAFGIHKQFAGREPRYIVFVRDPAKRKVSQYNHEVNMMVKPAKFEAWYKSQIKNEQVFLLNKKFLGVSGRKAPSFTDGIHRRYLAKSKPLKLLASKILKFFISTRNRSQELQGAKKMIESCYFVGITERLDSDLELLFRLFGVGGTWERFRTAREGNPDISKREVKKVFSLDEATKERIYQDNVKEVELYDYAKIVNLKTRERIQNDLALQCAIPCITEQK